MIEIAYMAQIDLSVLQSYYVLPKCIGVNENTR